MKLIVALVLTFAVVALARPQAPVAQIRRSDFDVEGNGAYKFGFETDNGIVRDETGELKLVKDEEGKDHEVVAVRGSYSYTGPEGQPISVQYVADETGFHAEGDHIPKPA